MTDYIYARVSTLHQSTAAQELSIRAKYPHATILSEIASGAKRRPILEQLLAQLTSNDRLIVAAFDRLGRNCVEILTLIENLSKKNIILISEREGVDYSTPIGRLVTQIFISIAEMERSLIIERTKAGLAIAKSKGKILGAQPKNKLRKGKYKIMQPLTESQRRLSHKQLAKELRVAPSTAWAMLRRANRARV